MRDTNVTVNVGSGSNALLQVIAPLISLLALVLFIVIVLAFLGVMFWFAGEAGNLLEGIFVFLGKL